MVVLLVDVAQTVLNGLQFARACAQVYEEQDCWLLVPRSRQMGMEYLARMLIQRCQKIFREIWKIHVPSALQPSMNMR